VSRRVLLVLALTLILLGALVMYTLTHQPPRVPADADHLSSDDPQTCLDCHGRGKRNARSKNRPLNDRCWECHERAR